MAWRGGNFLVGGVVLPVSLQKILRPTYSVVSFAAVGVAELAVMSVLGLSMPALVNLFVEFLVSSSIEAVPVTFWKKPGKQHKQQSTLGSGLKDRETETETERETKAYQLMVGVADGTQFHWPKVPSLKYTSKAPVEKHE